MYLRIILKILKFDAIKKILKTEKRTYIQITSKLIMGKISDLYQQVNYTNYTNSKE